MAINKTLNDNLFLNKVLEKEPVSQIFRKDTMAEAFYGSDIARLKAEGLTNEFMIQLGNTHELMTMNSANLTRPAGGGQTDLRATLAPVIQSARLRVDGPLYQQMKSLSAAEMFLGIDGIARTFSESIDRVVERQLMGKKDGRLFRVANAGAGATLTAYRDDGTTLLPADHIMWQHVTVGKIYQLLDFTTSAETVGGYKAGTGGGVMFQVASFVPSTGVITITDATASPLTGGSTPTVFTTVAANVANHVYYLAPYSPLQILSSASAAVAIQYDGLQDWVSTAAAYLTTAPNASSTGASIANTTAGYEMWRTLSIEASGDLSQIHFDQAGGCASGKPNLIVCDPAVLAKAMHNEAAKRTYVTTQDAVLGFLKLMYVSGDTTFRVKTSRYLRGTGKCYLIDTSALKMFGTVLTPEFELPKMTPHPDSWFYFNDLFIRGNFYTNCRSKHVIITGCTQAY